MRDTVSRCKHERKRRRFPPYRRFCAVNSFRLSQRYQETDTRDKKRNEELTEEFRRITKQYNDMQAKFRHFEISDNNRYEQVPIVLPSLVTADWSTYVVGGISRLFDYVGEFTTCSLNVNAMWNFCAHRLHRIIHNLLSNANTM